MSVNLKEWIIKGKSVEEIAKEIPGLSSSDGKYLEWMIWFVKQYDEEIKKVLEPKDEYNVFVNSTIKRLNALQ
jgi:hypothetical protein